MYTTCPHCNEELSVTAAELRRGSGRVRCEICAGLFDALATLSDEGRASAVATGAPELPEVIADSATPLESALPHDEETGAPATTMEPDASEITGENEVLRTGTFETIVLEGDGILQTEEVVGEDEVDAQLQALVERFDAVRESSEQEQSWPHELATQRPILEDDDETSPAEALDLADEPPPDLDLDLEEPSLELAPPNAPLSVADVATGVDEATEPSPNRIYVSPSAEASDTLLPALEQLEHAVAAPVTPAFRRRRTLIALCGLAALVLAGQVVHHFRRDLAAKAWVEPALSAVYGAFGVHLEPSWSLEAYDVRQLGADAVPGNPAQIAVRASVRNGATRGQPVPILRIALQDRFGNPITTHEIAPQDYLRGNVPALLAADQRIDAKVLLPDPGQNAVGFEIDACLRDGRGALHCANDSVNR